VLFFVLGAYLGTILFLIMLAAILSGCNRPEFIIVKSDKIYTPEKVKKDHWWNRKTPPVITQ